MSSKPVIPMTPELQAQHDRTDAFIAEVTEQIMSHQFDDSNQSVLKRLVEEGLGDTRGVVRLRFAETLGQIGEPATPLLTEALAHHPNEVVRRAAAKTLTLISDPAAVPTLLNSFLHDTDQVVRSSSVGALARTGEVSVPPLLDILASDADETIKGHAAWALAFIGAEAAEYLTPALNSDNLDVRCAVLGAIVKVMQEQPTEKLLNVLIAALTDPEAIIRSEAASGLGQINDSSSVPHLIMACRDSDLDVRKSAVSALGKVGNESALAVLEAAQANDPEPVIQVLAKIARSQLERRLAEADWD
ncbi:MAG: HEAT repeat domain-containing protein [Alkalinema sp. RL_2_19]|nr:HEAT repeat domain-containing protein [Alkalinema sp. RL_2_19]